jgi:twitching motility protein PilT
MSAPQLDETFRTILRGAVESGASDIHIKPGAAVYFRIQGELVPVEVPPPSEAWLRMVLRSTIPPHISAHFEQEHEADFAFSDAQLGRFRVNVFLQRGQPAVAVRLVKRAVNQLDELNLPEHVIKLTEAPRGIVIIAGSTGSGKSTTLAALIEYMNQTSRRHIVTIEDPIEFLFEDDQCVIEQREVGLDTAGFASGLRHVLRQDPDVVVIGEMRDAESARAAMSAANIGRMVITTMHTNDVPRSIQRVLEFFPSAEREFARRLFAQTLHGILCQRLVHSEKSGVLPATELMFNNGATARYIETEEFEKVRGTIEMASAEGMHTFDQCLARMVTEGKITREEALQHAANPDMLRMAFQGVVVSDSGRILQSR